MPVVEFSPEVHSHRRERGSHLPHEGVLQDTHDPLNPVHGHALLEAAESWERRRRRKLQCWAVLDSRAESARQMEFVQNVCTEEQTPCFWEQEVLGHTRVGFDQDPKLSSLESSSGPGGIFQRRIKCLTDKNTNSSCFSLQRVVQYVPTHLCQV